MKTFEIYFSDLTAEKQEEMKQAGFYHANIELTPLAIIEIEDSDSEKDNKEESADLYLFINGKYKKTNLQELEAIHEDYAYDCTGFKEPAIYYKRDKNNHMIEYHYECETVSSPGSYPYCACALSKCNECGAEEYEIEGVIKLKTPCTGKVM